MTRRGLALFAAMCLIWGIPYLLIRIAVGEIAPVVLVFGRTAIGAFVLMPIVLGRGLLRGIGGKWIPMLAFAATEVALPWFFLSSAEQHLSSSLAALLISAVPLVATLVAPLFGNRERMGLPGLAGMILGLGGVAAIVGLDLRATDATSLVEMGLVAVCYAVGPSILQRYLGGVPSVSVIGVSLTASALCFAAPAVLAWPRVLPSAPVLASVGVLGLVCTALAFLLFFELIAEVGPVRSTVITYINPAVAAVAGLLVLGEKLTVGMGVGFALVLAGSILAARRRGAREPVPEGGS